MATDRGRARAGQGKGVRLTGLAAHDTEPVWRGSGGGPRVGIRDGLVSLWKDMSDWDFETWR